MSRLPLNYHASYIIYLTLSLFVIPLSVWAVLQPTHTRFKAAEPISSPVTPPHPECQPVQNRIIIAPPESPGCHDLQAAVNAIPDNIGGYYILFGPGTYPLENADHSFSVTIANKTGLAIAGQGTQNRAAARLTLNGNRGGIYITNSSLSLTNLTISGSTTNGLLYIDNAQAIAIDNVRLSDSGANTAVMNNLQELRITNSTFSSSSNCLTPNQINPIVIQHNTFINCNIGIEAYQVGGNIAYNLFDTITQNGIYLISMETLSVHHNTLVNLPTKYGNYAIMSDFNIPDRSSLNLDHNLIVSPLAGVVINQPSSLHAVFTSNNVSTQGPKYTGIADQTGTNGNIATDPLFGNHDYCLTAGSPSFTDSFNFMGHYGSCSRYDPRRDINQDNQVNTLDFSQLVSRLGRSDTLYPSADLDEDGHVDFLDYTNFMHYLQ